MRVLANPLQLSTAPEPPAVDTVTWSRTRLQNGLGRWRGSRLTVEERSAALDNAVLTTQALEARYGSVRVLHGVDVVVNRGEIVTLLGTNGVGKTTFIQTVM